MNTEEGKTFQAIFAKFCADNRMKTGAAYFASADDQSAIMAYHNVSDNDLMHIAANLLMHVAHKNNISIAEVMQALVEGMTAQDRTKQN